MSVEALQNTVNKLKRIRSAGNTITAQIIDTQLKEIADSQRERIDKGVNADGGELEYNKSRSSPLNSSGAYTRQYDRYKKKRGGQTQHVDLKLTGSYQNQIKAQRQGLTKVEIGSADSKAPFIEGNYNSIYGFTPQQKAELIAKIKLQVYRVVKTVFTK